MTKIDELSELLKQANSFSDDGKFEDAISLFNELTRRVPEKAIFWCLLGDTYRSFGDHAAAVHAYETALKKDPDHQLSQLALAQICMDVGELERAEGWLMTALLTPNNHNMVYTLLGSLRGKQERWKESEEYCSKAIEADPLYEEAYLFLGISFMRQGRVAEANRAIRRALEIDPEYEDAKRALKTLRQF